MGIADNVLDDDFYEMDNPTQDTYNELEDRVEDIGDSIIMIMNESFWEDDLYTEKKEFLSDKSDEYIGTVTIQTKTPEFAFSIDHELNQIFLE